MDVRHRLSIIAVAVFIVAFLTLTYMLLGSVPAVVIGVATIGGLILWLATTFHYPIDPQLVIVPYLLTVIFFIAHVYEEYLTNFEVAMTDITGFHVLERNFLTVAAFFGPILWLSGAILILKRKEMGYYFLSLFYVAMTIAELSHFVFPFLEDGTFHYVSGMYTAAIPLIPAGYGLRITLREVRRLKRNSKAESAHGSGV